MAARFLQLDVFCERPGGGNPLGVVFGADNWGDADMQGFATWTNLVETTFVLPPTRAEASYRLRIFTPAREIPFAGHPTIGSAFAVLHTEFAQPRSERLVQECGAGLLPIRIEAVAGQQQLFVQAPAARLLLSGPAAVRQSAAALLRLPPGRTPVALVEGGRRWWLAEAASESSLRQWQPDHAAIAALALETGALGVCAYARADRSTDYDLVVRAFPAGVGIVEDPASGAANGLLAAWLKQQVPSGPLAGGYRVSQGRELGRDARIQIEFGADDSVWVGGCTQLVLNGALYWCVTPRSAGGNQA